jgi:hypothetical protein
MDATTLIGPASAIGSPAPFWFLEFFKVLGFILHMLPMHLWLAGGITAMLLSRYGSAHARRFSGRLMGQMPIIISAGVNLGIVPLLFTQVAYHRVFYPATILSAWFWFAVVFMLGVAYYGVYLYVLGLRGTAGWLKPYTGLVGWISALLFIAISLIFAQTMTLMTNVGAWQGLWEHTSVAGAPLGIALNFADPTLIPRWLMHLGLAFTTLAAYIVFDAAVFAGKESPEYRQAMPPLALKTGAFGLAVYAACGAWYVLGTLPPASKSLLAGGWTLVLFLAAGICVGLPWLINLLQLRKASLGLAAVAMVLQFIALALNAVCRQLVQNAELKPFIDVAAAPLDIQWSPLILFLLIFVAGLGVVFWMLGKVVEANRRGMQQKPAVARKH